MKKLVVLLLLMISTNVFAEWTEVRESEVETDYTDFESIVKEGNKVKMWNLYDYKTIKSGGGVSYLSSLYLEEVDCENHTKRLLEAYLYSGNMKSGQVVFSQTKMKMKEALILPDSMIEISFNLVCGKK